MDSRSHQMHVIHAPQYMENYCNDAHDPNGDNQSPEREFILSIASIYVEISHRIPLSHHQQQFIPLSTDTFDQKHTNDIRRCRKKREENPRIRKQIMLQQNQYTMYDYFSKSQINESNKAQSLVKRTDIRICQSKAII